MARASAGVMSAARTAVSASTVASAATRTVFVFIVVGFRARAEAFFTRFSHPSFYLLIGLKSYQKKAFVEFTGRILRMRPAGNRHNGGSEYLGKKDLSC